MYGFFRAGAAVPKLKVADCEYNREQILEIVFKAEKENLRAVVFPELSLSAYTCGDLFFQNTLIKACEESLGIIAEKTAEIDMFIILGLPVAVGSSLFNCAAVLYMGKILGLIPKTYVPNYGEFYEKRWFASAREAVADEIDLCSQRVPVKANMLFRDTKRPEYTFGVEICEDLWGTIPPSSFHALKGATVIFNLSASNELASKNEYRKGLISKQSAAAICGYVYSSAGEGESSQDVVFSGHAVICENGSLLSENKRFLFENQLIYSDIDVDKIISDRQKNTSFSLEGFENYCSEYLFVDINMTEWKEERLYRHIDRMPFVPGNGSKLFERCEDIFNIQVSGLAKRVRHTNAESLVIGISGGLDSTLALLAAVKTCDYLGVDRKKVLGVTMPGFGTTDRTYNNAVNLMKSLGVTMSEISIKEASILHFNDIGHDINVRDTTYENTQARERTQILMDLANKHGGLVIGTGDLSELALGWATYNGDHMSMYGINSGVPKTLVRVLVRYVAENGLIDDYSKSILMDILDTPVSPELLPPDDKGEINQKTEDIVGPYELHDFFLYYIVRFGFSPAKILFLAEEAFNGEYDRKTILKWLKNFYRRFFSQQFKRSCIPDGPKVGTINLSPRGDWRMPSDAVSRLWLKELEII
ncbi:NAD(+) synthase [Lachnospiraceae bacterium NSJ-143]|nr:NAD(+) synthase [Lachnospiraceae bacterium NSJ-143]